MSSLIRLLIFIAVIVGIYGVFKSLPEDTNIQGERFSVPSSSVTFLSDVTYVDQNGDRFSDQEIFDEIFSMINSAQNYILIDMFLFNDLLGTANTSYRQLSQELTNTLLQKKKSNPNIDIVFITDPINEIYGGYASSQLTSLREAGVHLVVTDLTQLRDSNPLYSAFWRSYFRWFKNSENNGWLPNPFDERLDKLTLRSYLGLFNFKANHRKVVLTDYNKGTKFSVLITSANPHDGSSAHTNTAIKIDDALWKDVLRTELAVADFSKVTIPTPDTTSIIDRKGDVIVQLLTESAIRDVIIENIHSLENDDTFDMAMFYLSDRKVIEAIKKAASRGVTIRIILDPNKDAFGREKNGIPNRQVASELTNIEGGNITIRWCDTHGEQCHSKLLLFNDGETYTLIQGSANLTRRNIGNYNLETNVLVESNTQIKAISDAYSYFNTFWNNEVNKTYSSGYGVYQDDSKPRYYLYRIMEDFGLSTF